MIKENVQRILDELPQGVELVAAAKTRTPEEIREAVEAGINIVGENYVQEAFKAMEKIGRSVSWHLIGHLQKNKVRKAVSMFDLIQTVDSFALAREIDKASRSMGEEALELIEHIGSLQNVKCMGLMTMGPRFGNPEDFRPYFAATRRLYEKVKGLNLPNIEMKYLSMGMTNSYLIALQEGANMVRIGTKIFGERKYENIS
jgi:hypothetical protein